MQSPAEISAFIRQMAREEGFSACGIAPVSHLAEESSHLDHWLSMGYHARMAYMENHREARLDPRLLVEGARSVIVMLFNYYPQEMLGEDSGYRISCYAYGDDYHDVIREKLNRMIAGLKQQLSEIVIRGFVDSAPVLERAWATRAGLGWIGKNSMLISRKNGSYFFIAELITDLVLEYDSPFGGDYCGDCNRCIQACPTGAITSPRIVDAGKCISYLTIENKGEIDNSLNGKYDQWIFGCDVCQTVCPWNRYAVAHTEPRLIPSEPLRQMTDSAWENLSPEGFSRLFRRSAVKRAKFEGLKRNISFLDSPDNLQSNGL